MKRRNESNGSFATTSIATSETTCTLNKKSKELECQKKIISEDRSENNIIIDVTDSTLVKQILIENNSSKESCDDPDRLSLSSSSLSVSRKNVARNSAVSKQNENQHRFLMDALPYGCLPISNNNQTSDAQEMKKQKTITSNRATYEKCTGIIYEIGQQHHDVRNRFHRERPDRIIRIKQHLEKTIFSKEKQNKKSRVLVLNDQNMKEIGQSDENQIMSGKDFLNEEDYLRVHLEGYMRRLNRLLSCTCQLRLEREAEQYESIYLTKDTVSSAKQAAGSFCDLVSKVVQQKLKNGFAIIRPPGHHAEPGLAGGFCIINNIAVAAAYARTNLGVQKVMIVDWDVHHGNGTQSIFLNDPNVIYFSVHRYHHGNFFPYSSSHKSNSKNNGGGSSAIGVDEGKGYNVNIGWNQSKMGNLEYIAVWETLLMPMLTEYKPDLVLISAGFDCAKGDSMGDCNVTPDCFGWLTKRLLAGNTKVVCTLEGGYVNSLLGICVENVLEVLMDEEWDGLREVSSLAKEFCDLDLVKNNEKMNQLLKKIHPSAARSIRATMKAHAPYWTFLRKLRS